MAASLKLSEQGKRLVDDKRRFKGWNKDSLSWCEEAKEFLKKDGLKKGASVSTLGRFQKGEFIKAPVFQAFCQAVGVNWMEARDQSSPDAPQKVVFDPCENVPSTEGFRGRDADLAQLKKLVQDQNTRFVCIYGLPGIGKTQLAAKLYQMLQPQFARRLWQPLNEEETVQECLADLVDRLMPNSNAVLASAGQLIKLLLQELRKQRILLVLDEKVVSAARFSSLFEELIDKEHQSCVILTSQTRPDVTFMGGQSTVKTYQVRGLEVSAVSEILQDKEVECDLETIQTLHHQYQGHPLAIKFLASHIRDHSLVPDGQDILLHEKVTRMFDRVISQLAQSEKKILIHLAQVSPIRSTAEELEMELGLSRSDCIKALRRLSDRSLLEKEGEDRHYLYTLQPMIMQFVRERLNCSHC